jgi:Bacterial regulatory proteins, luxR family
VQGPAEAIGDAYTGTLVLNARARLRLAQGDAGGALADLLEVGRRQEAMREPNPAAVDWRCRPPSPTRRWTNGMPRSGSRRKSSSSPAASAPRVRSGWRCARSVSRSATGAASSRPGNRFAGDSNRQIAQALYLSHKTVEKHLTATYRKLGVGGRADLPSALAERVGAPPHTPPPATPRG